MHTKTHALPRAFVWRRIHSLTGLWLVAFLTIHLLTNSQAALWVGEDGQGFVRAANSIQEIPFIKVIEIFLIALPFLVHAIWGIQYLWTGEYNSFATDGAEPSLPRYPRNQAYTWQRITSWFLLILITGHVIQMRFMEAPWEARQGTTTHYMVRLQEDDGLYSLSKRLGVSLYDSKAIAALREKAAPEDEWLFALEKRSLVSGQLIAVTPDFGTAELLMVRDTFKIPAMLVLYTVLVLSACFHAFNGFWTFLITWGVTLSPHSQDISKRFALTLMAIISFLGLAAIWGSFWLNLRQ